MTLSEAQRRALSALASGRYPYGARRQTLRALSRAGLVALTYREVDETYRPSRYWSATRWTRRVLRLVAVDITPAGRAALGGAS